VTNLLIVSFGGNEVGRDLCRLSTGLQSRLSTLGGIVRTVQVPGDTTDGGSADTSPEKGVGRAFGCLSGVFSETRTSKSRNPVRGGGTSSQTGRRAERRANSRGEHGGRKLALRLCGQLLEIPHHPIGYLNTKPANHAPATCRLSARSNLGRRA